MRNTPFPSESLYISTQSAQLNPLSENQAKADERDTEMKRRISTLVAVALAVSVIGTFGAFAEETSTTSTVTATVQTPAGTRILQPVNAPAAIVFITSRTATAVFTASVIESLADGVPNWTVTLKAGDFARTGGGGTVAASNLSYTGVTHTATALGDLSGTIQAGTNGALNGSGKTMFTVAGETSGSFPGYTGTYTGAGTLSLTLPAGTTSGTYTATVTVTLIA